MTKTIPSSYYRDRLCVALGKTEEELGFMREPESPLTTPFTSLVFLASSHIDAEKPIIAHLKIALHNRGIKLWSSRRNGKQETSALHEIIRTAQAVVVIVSPEARSSRYVRNALELAQTYQRPVCAVWIEGESWQEYLPGTSKKLVTSIDARKSDNPALLEEIVATLEEMGRASHNSDSFVPSTSEVQITAEPSLFIAPVVSSHRKYFFSIRTRLLLVMVLLLMVSGAFGSLGVYPYFRALNPSATIAHGGTWINGLNNDPDSLIPNGSQGTATGQADAAGEIDQALYLPLFYGDAQGVIHAGAAAEVPTLQNGDVNATATVWTFRLRPHLQWSDGQPYDARDVDYTWRLWVNPSFGASNTSGLNLISRADVSPDYLSITFHLKQPFTPFLAGGVWVDGIFAPLPAHHFSSMAPSSILKSTDNLSPKVTSGPFMISESGPGSRYTLIRNLRYYRASEGQPYLDKVIFLSNAPSYASVEPELQAGLLDSTTYMLTTDADSYKKMRSFTNYSFFTPPSIDFEAMYFNFHNRILATHLEVRQAMAMAIDQPAMIDVAIKNFANPLCTDHTSIYHPGYEPSPPCPLFDLNAANKLLDDNGWQKGVDGVRAKKGQRLEFEYSTALSTQYWRLTDETILHDNFQKIGIKLDIQNYPPETFFGSFLSSAAASPSSGAVAGRYDIAEFANGFGYDPDDSSLLACDLKPPNIDFYCNHDLDALYKQEQATADFGIRQQIFVHIHRIYLTQLPFIVLFSPFLIVMAKKRVHNYQPGPFYTNTNMAEWWCDQGKC